MLDWDSFDGGALDQIGINVVSPVRSTSNPDDNYYVVLNRLRSVREE